MAEIVATAPKGILDAVPGLKQVALLTGVAAAVAAAIWLVLWSQGQNYTVLYGQLSDRESGQVMDALTAAGIEFKLNPSGAVLVPDSKVQEARIRLASQGLPQSDAMGIEMIQKESSLGTSSMMESARYQSVLETELARTIIKVQGVQTARVHLALPKPSVFLRDSHKATASVMLQLYPGRRLEPGQVEAIVHLVASSVPELSATDVTLVDQAGTLLNSSDNDSEPAVSTRQFEYTRKLEESYQKRIVELLEPMVGVGRVRATVTAAQGGSRARMISVLSGISRTGVWRVPAEIRATNVLGSTDLDLREALLPAREITIRAICVLGGMEITVPPEMHVIDDGWALMGGREIPPDSAESVGADATVLRLRGISILGGMTVRRQRRAGRGSGPESGAPLPLEP